MATQNADLFDAYFRRADLDQDGRITGSEAVAFFQNSNLPKQVLAQIWTYADQHKTGFLGRNEFYNFLKLVTVAQSKRELTPDIVKAALYGPACAKIPPPQINLAATPAPPSNPTTVPAPPQLSAAAPTPSQSMGVSVPQVSANVNMSRQFFPSQANQTGKPPCPAPPTTSLHPQQGVAASHPPGTNISSNWCGGTPTTLAGQATPKGITSSSTEDGHGMTALDITSAQPRPQASAGMMQLATPRSYDATLPSSQVGAKVSKSVAVSGNGPSSDSFFGDAFSVTAPLPKQDTAASAFPADGSSVLPATVPASTGSQNTVRPGSLGSSPVPFTQQLTGNQHQQVMMKVNQQAPGQNSTIYGASTAGFAGAPHSASGQSQVSWPRMTPIDVQKYNKVFIEVDSDRDGKITGEQARNLFLSWRLPREILKQVWDLSDQDNDSMLSLREFCIALYLMERYREGRPLPKTLPDSIMIDEALLPASGRQAAVYGNTAWRPAPGLQQPQVTPAARPPIPPRPKPPNQVPVPVPDEAIQPTAQKSKVPVLEKHLVNQLSEGEQNSLNAKFNEASEANKKVEELEKEIIDSRKKIVFFRSKMQELVLYKSRCDSRLNEITERTSMDKREVESLAKNYEEKYKQSGDVASKLSIEEATFRDIQEKKMELYRSIVRSEDGKADSIQINADKIQFELEELMKSVNERCKSYGLRAKPTTLVELPFGWQPGIQEGAADWDENWDKFEDEGFTFVKDLTLDVQNVIAPPKPKTSSLQSKGSSTKDGVQDALANGDHKSEKIPIREDRVNDEASSEEGKPKSPPESPAHASSNPSQKLPSDPSKKEFIADGSPHAMETQSELGGSEFLFSGEKSSDKPGAFDMHFDTESAWDFDPGSSKELDFDKRMGYAFFDSGDLGLPPIRTDASHKGASQQKNTFVFDSVPSTPQTDNLFQKKSTLSFDSVPSTPQTDNLFPTRSTFAFDSVPSTPLADNLFPTKSAFAFDSVPSTPQADNMFQKKPTFDSIPTTPQADNLFQQKSAFAFDSVPSTPMYNYNSNSPRRLSEGSGLSELDSFSRFDSFNTHDGGLFPTREPLSRFDSFSSTRESDYGQGFSSQDAFSRFDSFRSTTKDSDSGFFAPRDYARFDSFQSTKDGDESRGFNTFDDSDPFGSSGPFKTSFYSQTPRKDSDDWKAF